MGKPMTPKPMNAAFAIASPLSDLPRLRPARQRRRRNQNFVERLPAGLVRRQHQAALVYLGGHVSAALDITVVATRLGMDQDAGAMVPGHQFGEQGEVHFAGCETEIFRRGAATCLDGVQSLSPRLDLPAEFTITEEPGEQHA